MARVLLFSCDVDVENNGKNRTKPFTQLVNTVLDSWDLHREELEHEMGFRRPSDEQSLIFQRNGSSSLPSTRRSVDGYLLHDDTQRSPDIIALSLESAIKTSNDPVDTLLTSASWTKHAEIAAGPPHHAPSFSDVLMSWKFELAKKKNMPSVPTSYRYRALSACESHPLLALTLNAPETRPPPSSVQTSHTPTAIIAASEKTGHKRHASAMEEPEVLGRVSKAPRMSRTEHESVGSQFSTMIADPCESTSRHSSAAAQSAIYAAERLCSSPFFTHALNVVVIGE